MFNVSEVERFQLLRELRNLVEIKYSDNSITMLNDLDNQIIEILNKIRIIEYYIF